MRDGREGRDAAPGTGHLLGMIGFGEGVDLCCRLRIEQL